jgi:polyisoprenoid-binding protein YceI
LTGSVTVDQNDLGASRFELEFPVASLVVDDMKLRGTLGAEFSSVPTAKDVAGTKTNMLSGRVLDAEKHPRIRIVGTGPGWRDGRTVLSVKVEMLGRTLDLTVPAEVTIANDELRANGEFQLDHADLGLQPFSVMAGALRVGEQLSFVYDIKARQAAR